MRENLVPLSGDGTRLCHGAVQFGYRTYDMSRKTYVDPVETEQRIRARMSAAHIAYVIERKGVDWMDRVYPPS